MLFEFCQAKFHIENVVFDDLFNSLHNNPPNDNKITIASNPGSIDCDRNIAVNKGWVFLYE